MVGRWEYKSASVHPMRRSSDTRILLALTHVVTLAVDVSGTFSRGRSVGTVLILFYFKRMNAW